MKKTIITALIALLIMLAFASCDSIIPELGVDKPEYTADGQQLVTVKVNTGGTTSRGIDSEIAHKGANYVEVIFYNADTDKYYKTEGLYGFTLTVQVPKKTYDKTNSIMLIGRKTGDPGAYDYTLLATGTLGSTGVNVATKDEIKFTVTSLKADLSINGDSFKITNGWIPGFKDDATGPGANKTKSGSFEHGFNCFLVPSNSVDLDTSHSGNMGNLTASLTITGLDATGDYISLDDDADLDDTVIFTEFPSGDPSASTDISLIPDSVDVTIDSTDNCVIRFSFKTGPDGYHVITFNIPVIGLTGAGFDNSDPTNVSDFGSNILWHIRGGTKGDPDLLGNHPEIPGASPGDPPVEKAVHDAGEGVAIQVSETVEGSKTITVPPSKP